MKAITAGVSVAAAGIMFWLMPKLLALRSPAELQELLDRLNKIASQLPGVVFQYRLRPDGSCCMPYVSEGFRQIYRFNPAEFREDAARAFSRIHADDLDSLKASIQASAAELSPWTQEFRVKCDIESYRWLLGNAMPQQEADGAILWHGFLTDITARKAMEQTLRELSVAVEQSPASVTITGLDGGIVYINDGFVAINGYSKEEALGKNPKILKSGVNQCEIYLQMWAALCRGEVWHGELLNRKKNGHTYWADTCISPVRDELGAVSRYVGVALDVSERKRVEQQLLESQRELKMQGDIKAVILDALPAHIALLDSRGCISQINRGWREFAQENGPAADKIGIGGNYLDFCPGFSDQLSSEFKDAVNGIRHVLDGDHAEYVMEYPCHSPDKQRWYRMNIVALSVTERLGAVLMHIDITESKLHQQEIMALNQSLEQRVQNRTRQLQAANRELETFSYTVSHDLLRPLRSISWFSQLLRSEHAAALPVAAQQYVENIVQATFRMEALIENLLKLSKAGNEQLRVELFNISQMAADILGELQQTEPRRKTAIKIMPDLHFYGDPGLMKIMLENLLANAWKFTRNREVTEIAFGARQDAGKTSYFVQDNGVGFDQQQADKLFGAFQRLHDKQEFEGSGIGLATVKRIISRHNGFIWAESRADAGATFIFQAEPGKQELPVSNYADLSLAN